MNLEFYRKLPVPKQVKSHYPITADMERVKTERDAEIKKIVDESYNMAKEILTQKREKLDFITEFLMRNEIMDDEQFALAMQDGVTMEEVESLMTEKKRRSEEENKRRTEELRRKKEEEEAERRRLERELGLSDDSQENAPLEAPKADNEVTVDEEDFAGEEKSPENEEAQKEDTENQSKGDVE